MQKIRIIFLLALSFSFSAHASAPLLNRDLALKHMFANIAPYGTRAGVVIASPSRSAPDYYFHWIRDAALVMDQVVFEYERAASGSQAKLHYRNLLEDFAFFSLENQATPAQEGLGEPKFHVDGRVFTGDWARPQNDGPALRAITFMHWGNALVKEGAYETVKTLLFHPDPNHVSLIRTDLEYVVKNWSLTNFDLWEETFGTHYYTRFVQAKSLLLGAKFVAMMGDAATAARYERVGLEIMRDMSRFWSADLGYILTTIDWRGGVDFKRSNLDTSVLLAALHVSNPGEPYSITDRQVLATMVKIRDVFANQYKINKNGAPGVAIGRYPEDLYAGGDFSGGNPWALLTLAYAETYYRLAEHFANQKKVPASPELEALLGMEIGSSAIRSHDPKFTAILQRFADLGDASVARVKYHSGPNESLPEQFHRETGFKVSAPDLTWSYASAVAALRARADLEKAFARNFIRRLK